MAAGGFLEWAELPTSGHLYGTPRTEAEGPDDVILVIEVQGAAQVLDRVPGALMVFIAAPDEESLRERMQARGDDPTEVEARIELGRRETETGRALAAAVVVNDDLARSVDEVARILQRHRSSAS